MRGCLVVLGFLLGMASCRAVAQSNETRTLVRVSAFDGTTSVESLTPAQLAELRKDILRENKLIKEAYGNVTKAWRKRHEGSESCWRLFFEIFGWGLKDAGVDEQGQDGRVDE